MAWLPHSIDLFADQFQQNTKIAGPHGRFRKGDDRVLFDECNDVKGSARSLALRDDQANAASCEHQAFAATIYSKASVLTLEEAPVPLGSTKHKWNV